MTPDIDTLHRWLDMAEPDSVIQSELWKFCHVDHRIYQFYQHHLATVREHNKREMSYRMHEQRLRSMIAFGEFNRLYAQLQDPELDSKKSLELYNTLLRGHDEY